MNNKKILVVGVLAVIVTMMVGYALFSENITINGTATAKGDFALTTTCEKGISSVLTSLYPESIAELTEGGYENDYCTASGNTVSFGSNLLYPGAARYFTVSVKNTGTIDAVLNITNGIEVQSGNLCLDKDEDGTYETCISLDDPANSSVSRFVSLVDGFSTMLILDSDNKDVTYERIYNDQGVLDDEGDNVRLKVGDTFVTIMQTEWPSSLDNYSLDSNLDKNKLTLKHTGVSVKLNFVQVSN